MQKTIKEPILREKSKYENRFLPEGSPQQGIKDIKEEISLLEKKTELMYGLPYLYGWKFYSWAREFFESTNKLNFLCAANQISKSSTQIRKAIHWATEDTLWPELWLRKPTQFWYLYPSQEVVNAEFELKWSQFLPRGQYKDDPKYGWQEIKRQKDTIGIRFNSGVVLFFKTYTKNVSHLQTGSCDAIFCDEELPENLYSELINRLNATDGYFHMVFTATLGQEIWRLTMDPKETEEEKFKDAAKWCVSLYEALFYEDGTRSHWTEERISNIIAKCATHAEVLKRVYGRFAVAEGRKFPQFDATRHMKEKHPIPKNWLIYAGVDPGSGGEQGHPAAISFIAVRPDFRAARCFAGWRGDKIATTNDSIVKKFKEMKKELKIESVTAQYYDWANKDFEMTARGMDEPFLKAEKSHEVGEGLINTLFKNDMLFIYEDEELSKLGTELSVLRLGQNKRKAKDDFVDSFRYALSSIPFDLSGLIGKESDFLDTPEKPMNAKEREIYERRKAFEEPSPEEINIQAEFDEWNELYG